MKTKETEGTRQHKTVGESLPRVCNSTRPGARYDFLSVSEVLRRDGGGLNSLWRNGI